MSLYLSHISSLEDLSSEEQAKEIRVCKQRFERPTKGKTITYIKVQHSTDKYNTRCDTYKVTAKVNCVTVKTIIAREYVTKDAVELVTLSSYEESSDNNQESNQVDGQK